MFWSRSNGGTGVLGVRVDDRDCNPPYWDRWQAEVAVTSGWNHIVLRVGERWAIDSGLSYSSVKWLMIFFQDGGSDYNPVAGMKVAIANVYATTDAIDIIPAYPDCERIEVSKEGKKKSWAINTITPATVFMSIFPLIRWI